MSVTIGTQQSFYITQYIGGRWHAGLLACNPSCSSASVSSSVCKSCTWSERCAEDHLTSYAADLSWVLCLGYTSIE